MVLVAENITLMGLTCTGSFQLIQRRKVFLQTRRTLCYFWRYGYCVKQVAAITVFRLSDRSQFGSVIETCNSSSLVASSPLCDSILVEIKCINICCNTAVFSNCWRKLLHVLALFWVGHHQVETRISEKLIYYNVDIKNGERDLVLQCLARGVAIYTRFHIAYILLHT
jgi:hypothetical protein